MKFLLSILLTAPALGARLKKHSLLQKSSAALATSPLDLLKPDQLLPDSIIQAIGDHASVVQGVTLFADIINMARVGAVWRAADWMEEGSMVDALVETTVDDIEALVSVAIATEDKTVELDDDSLTSSAFTNLVASKTTMDDIARVCKEALDYKGSILMNLPFLGSRPAPLSAEVKGQDRLKLELAVLSLKKAAAEVSQGIDEVRKAVCPRLRTAFQHKAAALRAEAMEFADYDLYQRTWFHVQAQEFNGGTDYGYEENHEPSRPSLDDDHSNTPPWWVMMNPHHQDFLATEFIPEQCVRYSANADTPGPKFDEATWERKVDSLMKKTGVVETMLGTLAEHCGGFMGDHPGDPLFGAPSRRQENAKFVAECLPGAADALTSMKIGRWLRWINKNPVVGFVHKALYKPVSRTS